MVKKEIVVVLRTKNKVMGNMYESNPNSLPLFPSYSASTAQDFDELSKVLKDNNINSNDYERWYVAENHVNGLNHALKYTNTSYKSIANLKECYIGLRKKLIKQTI